MTTQLRIPSLMILLALIVGCGAEVQEQVEVARPVKMIALGIEGGATGLEYPGAVSDVQEAQLSFEVDGQVISFPVVEGQRVRAGQVLARLDARSYEANRNADLAARSEKLANYERLQDLYAADAVSLQDLDVARREYEVAAARLEISQKAVDDTRLRALFSGVVARKLVEEFENVQAKQPILLLQSGGGLEMRVNIPERYLVFAGRRTNLEELNARANPEVEIAALPGRRFPGRITEFASAADPVTRTFRVTVAFSPPDDAQILPGMTGKVVTNPALAGAGQNRYWVPSAAVAVADDGTWYVWRVDQTTMQVSRVAVEAGAMSGSEVEITGSLELGDLIATSGVQRLREGMKVSRAEQRG
ncbi:MAG: efflux RND transporter periplasmic adaptor subunit [Gemmatimonadota bacterium]|nr:MAG: efflux RND transporter periplasmic adaptor subunit [Gemmatimonadota bacterium]